MNSYNLAKLTAKVKATNAANKNAMALYAAFAPIAQSFIGRNIFKADGKLTKKFFEALPKLDFFFYRYNSNYSLVYIAKESVQVEGHSCCIYAEATAYIGDMELTTLKKLLDAPVLRTDYTVEEIIDLRKIAEKAKKDAQDAESALYPFGFYDN